MNTLGFDATSAVDTSCTVAGCPCMERDGILAEIESSALLETRADYWTIATAIGSWATFLALLVLIVNS